MVGVELPLLEGVGEALAQPLGDAVTAGEAVALALREPLRVTVPVGD